LPQLITYFFTFQNLSRPLHLNVHKITSRQNYTFIIGFRSIYPNLVVATMKMLPLIQLDALEPLAEALKIPQPLQKLARTAVHRALGSRLPRAYIPLLPLPEPLRAYLLFLDLDLNAVLHAYKSTWEAIRGTSVFV